MESLKSKKITQYCVSLAVSCVIAGCGGNSSNNVAAPQALPSVAKQDTTQPDLTTKKTDQTESKATAPQVAVAPQVNVPSLPADWGKLRPLDYPRMVSLPIQYIPSATGKKLAIRVSLPADENGVIAKGPFPTVMVNSGYHPNLMALAPIKIAGGSFLGIPDPFLVRRGYAMVVADALGTGLSEGGWQMFGQAEQEAYGDVVDWIEQQPWANGKIGTNGISYLAISGIYAAQQRPDKIDAIFAAVPMGDAMRGTVGTGGLLNGVFMSRWATVTQFLSTQNLPFALLDWRNMKQIMDTTQEHIDQMDNYYFPLLEEALSGAPKIAYDSDFWRTRSPLENIDKVKAPTFVYGALRDIFQRDAPLVHEALVNNNVDTRLTVYKGTHLSHAFDSFVDGKDDTLPSAQFMMLQWFDKYLKGMDTALDEYPQVVQHVLNYPTKSTPEHFRNDSYSSTTEWPHPEISPERWYLHGGDMTITKEAPTSDEPVRTMEATEPAEVKWGKSSSGTLLDIRLTINDGTRCSPGFETWTLGIAILDTKPSCIRNNAIITKDALNYETLPMEEDYYINGPLQADIWISSTAKDAVVAVRVDEISPSGKLTTITHGLLLASMRAVNEERSRYIDGVMLQPYHYFTQDKHQPLTPGEVVKLPIEIFPTSVIIRKGHRLRVSITPSNQAQGMLDDQRKEAVRGGVTTIHNSKDYPSSLVLPMVPLEYLN